MSDNSNSSHTNVLNRWMTQPLNYTVGACRSLWVSDVCYKKVLAKKDSAQIPIPNLDLGFGCTLPYYTLRKNKWLCRYIHGWIDMIYVLDMYNCTSKLYIPSTIHTKYIFCHTLLIVYAVAYFDHKKYTAKIDIFSQLYVNQFLLMQTLRCTEF